MGGFHPWVLLSIASKRSLKLLGLWYVYPRMRGCCLGVLDSKKHNESLLMKHLHKFYNRLEIPWVKLIWQKFYSSGQLPVSVQRASFWWRDILKLLSSFKGLASIQLDDCGGYDPGYPWQTTWAAPTGVAQPTRRSLAGHSAARRVPQDTGKIS